MNYLVAGNVEQESRAVELKEALVNCALNHDISLRRSRIPIDPTYLGFYSTQFTVAAVKRNSSETHAASTTKPCVLMTRTYRMKVSHDADEEKALANSKTKSTRKCSCCFVVD